MSEDNGSWIPEAGETLKGTVVDIRTQDGGYGPYPLLVIDTGEEQTAVHAFHSVLRKELAKRRPGVGNEISITYEGQKQPKGGGRPYHLYRVTGGSVAGGGGYDWAQDLPETQVEPDLPVEAPAVPVADTSDVPF